MQVRIRFLEDIDGYAAGSEHVAIIKDGMAELNGHCYLMHRFEIMDPEWHLEQAARHFNGILQPVSERVKLMIKELVKCGFLS